MIPVRKIPPAVRILAALAGFNKVRRCAGCGRWWGSNEYSMIDGFMEWDARICEHPCAINYSDLTLLFDEKEETP